MPRAAAPLALVAALLLAGPVGGELPIERPGRVETLSLPYDPHWMWIAGGLLRRSALVDVDDGRMLGMLGSGFGMPTALSSPDGREVYVPETLYSRGSRGDRTDVLTFYDASTLAPTGEVVLPPKRALNALPMANEALSDDGRFAAVANMTPATSLTIVDLAERRLAGEISTPGCSLAWAAGPRRFFSLCMDGAMLLVSLDERGAEREKARSEPFFDPERDPVTEKAVRWGDVWLFASFEGWLHEVDVSGEAPVFREPWDLIGEAERRDGWRIGGIQHLAVHQASGRLYSLVHRGGPDTHKEAGTELWVYDLEKRERVQRIELASPGFTYLGVPLEFGRDWIWPFRRLMDVLLAIAPGPGIDLVAVTQDEDPRIVTGGLFTGGMAIYDARSGAFLRRVYTGNMGNVSLRSAGAAP